MRKCNRVARWLHFLTGDGANEQGRRSDRKLRDGGKHFRRRAEGMDSLRNHSNVVRNVDQSGELVGTFTHQHQVFEKVPRLHRRSRYEEGTLIGMRLSGSRTRTKEKSGEQITGRVQS